MQPIRIFASFDRDRDADLHELLTRQSHSPDSPFEVADWSGRVAGGACDDEGDASLGVRLQRVDALIVLCGERTESSVGVSLELRTAQGLGKPYFMIWGRREFTCTKPVGAKANDSMYTWIWALLKFQLGLEIRKGGLRREPA